MSKQQKNISTFYRLGIVIKNDANLSLGHTQKKDVFCLHQFSIRFRLAIFTRFSSPLAGRSEQKKKR